MSRHRPEPDVIDLTEEPDSPVLQSHNIPNAAPFRSAARSAARSARSSAAPRQSASSTVIDLTGDDDSNHPSLMGQQMHHGLVMINMHNNLHNQISGGGPGSAVAAAASRTASVFSTFSFGNLAHLTSLALGAATGSGSSSGGGSNGANNANNAGAHGYGMGHDAGRRSRSAHHQARANTRSFNHRMQHQQPQQADYQGHRNGAHQQDQQRRAAAAASARSGLLNELDLFGGDAGFNPLGDNLPNFNYNLSGGLFQPRLFAFNEPIFHGQSGRPASAADAYQPPDDALPGYTRSTGEDLVAVCASCEMELEYDPEEQDKGKATDEPPAKRTRRPKDRAEQHFWAVRTCGHVYCRACYENRRNGIKKDGSSSGSRAGASGSGAASSVMFVVDGKTIYCAVEGCDSDVTAKKQWQGLYV